jgi:flagellar motor switch protein FliN/FliY
MEQLGHLERVPLEIQAVLDERVMTVAEILELEPGSLIRMNRAAGENIQIRVGGVWVADGDILAVDDQICVRLASFRDRP